jgi:hypothetical protein
VAIVSSSALSPTKITQAVYGMSLFEHCLLGNFGTLSERKLKFLSTVVHGHGVIAVTVEHRK